MDLPLAAELHDWLAADGHEVFLDRDPRNGIAVGDEWVRRLHERLRWANALLCVITKDYQDSAWCTAELNTARLLGTRILPVRSGDVRHPLLDDVQHTDLTDPGLARERTARALDEIDAAGDAHWPDGRSPFPGLVPLDVDRHRVFFGRDREISDLVALVEQDQGGTLVVGPSGCGKSSLVRAGLIPALTGIPGMFPLVVSGHDPIGALAQNTAQRPLVVIDQLEQIFTHPVVDERVELAARLRETDAQVVCTIRPEYLTQLLSDPHLGDLCGRVYPVVPLRREALRQIIEEPARIAGITVDERLTARMIEDTGDGTALPLLAYTLAQLSDGLRRGGTLSSQRYDALGGVRGALLQQADSALRATTAGRRDVLAALLSLVTVDEHGRPMRRHTHDSRPELDEFVKRHLLTTDTIGGKLAVGVAHEAFLTEWPPLAEAISEHAAALRTRRAVEHAATEWSASGRTPSRLWQGAHLHVAHEDVTGRVDLTTTADDFLRASVRHDRRRRTRTVTVLSVLLVLALVGAAVAYNRQLMAQDRQAEAEQRQRVATVQRLVSQADALAAANAGIALRLGIAALHIDPANPSAKASVAQILTNTGYVGTLPDQNEIAYGPRASLLAGASADGVVTVQGRFRWHRLAADGTSLRKLVFSPDGRTLVTTSDTESGALLWDLTGTEPQRVGPVLSGWPITDIAFAPGTGTLAIMARDGNLRVWDVSEPAQAHTVGPHLDGHAGARSVAFAPGGKLLARGLELWDRTDPQRPRRAGTLPGHHDRTDAVAFSPDSKLAAVANGTDSGEAALVDVTDPNHPRLISVLPTKTALITDLAFSPDGSLLATAGTAGGTALWDVSNPLAPRRSDKALPQISFEARTVSFSVDGRTIATDGHQWSLTGRYRPTPVGMLFGGGTGSLAFSQDSAILAVGGEDRVALWRLSDLAAPLGTPLAGIAPRRTAGVEFSPDGRTLAAGETLQDVTRPAFPQQVRALKPGTALTKFSPDGKYLVTTTLGDGGKTATLWAASDPALRVAELRGHDAQIVAFTISPDSRLVIAVGADGIVHGWDVSAPTLDLESPDPLVGQLSDAASATFSPDGELLLAGASSGPALVWDTGGPFRVGRPIAGNMAQAVFAPHSRLLATSGSDGAVALWDLSDPATPRQLGPPLEHRAVGPLAFSPDGTTLAVGDRESGVRLWDVRPLTSVLDRPAKVACGIVGSGLSQREWERLVPDLPYRETCP